MTRKRRPLLILPVLAVLLGASSITWSSDDATIGMSPFDKLQATEEIRQLKARYFRCMDQKDWACFQATMHPNIDFNVSGALYAADSNPSTLGRETLGQVVPGHGFVWTSGDIFIDPRTIDQGFWQRNSAQGVREFEEFALGRAQTSHQGHMPEITITSPTTATALWTLTHHLKFTSDTPNVGFFPNNGQLNHELFGYGYYTEEYEKLPEGWRIKKLRFTSFRVDIH